MKGMDPLTETFSALADPTRRAIIARLATGEATVGELARPFDISGPAISRHLRVLEQAQLIERKVQAKWRVCSLRRDRLAQAQAWIEETREFWLKGFDRLEALLEIQDADAKPGEGNAMTVAPLVLVRHFKAPPERIFAAFTEKALMQSWYGPEPMTVPHCEVDARVGGKYRIEMHAASGSVHIVTGEFKEIVAPERLVFSWGWLNGAGRNPETLVTLTFKTARRRHRADFGTDGLRKRRFPRRPSRRLDLELERARRHAGRAPKRPDAAPVVMGDGRSTYTRAVRIAFFEKAIAHRLEPLQPHAPDILAHNPFGKIPVLRLGETSLYESSAILHYIDEAFPGPALMPKDPLARAKAEQWISVINCYADPAIVRKYVLAYVMPRGPDGKPDRAAIEAAIPEMRKALAALDAGYGASDYLVGNMSACPTSCSRRACTISGCFPRARTSSRNSPT